MYICCKIIKYVTKRKYKSGTTLKVIKRTSKSNEINKLKYVEIMNSGENV